MKLTVGVMPLFDEKKNSIWMLPNYLDMLEAGHLAPIILPYTTNKEVLSLILSQIDGILFTGGHDVEPSYYGHVKRPECGETLAVRDELEKFSFDFAIKNDVPILGICRGLQIFNVFYGGSLYQDLPTQFESTISHSQNPPYDIPSHNVTFEEHTDFAKWLNCRDYAVNSYHHQAIDKLAPDTDVLAMSEDGLIEAIKLRKQSFAYAVQWHPEFIWQVDRLTNHLIKEFHDACLDYHYVKGK